MNFSSRHSIAPLKASPATRKSFKHLKMVCYPIQPISTPIHYNNNGILQFIVPSAPPDNVQAGMLNLTAGWVRWSPPPPQHHNGHLLGYKIQVSILSKSLKLMHFEEFGCIPSRYIFALVLFR